MNHRLFASFSLACAALCASLAPASAQAASTFEDTNLAGWASSLSVGGACPSLTTAHPGSGGNGGAFLQYTQAACGPMAASHFSSFTWNPATQGAFDTVTIGYDANWQSGSFSGDTRIGTSALLRQNGQLFYALYNEVAGPAWSHFSGTLTADNWTRLDGQPLRPDFSGTGGVIEFGLSSSNNCPGCGKTLSGGFDNYSVTLALTSAVPEPTSAALAAMGLLLVSVSARRKRLQ